VFFSARQTSNQLLKDLLNAAWEVRLQRCQKFAGEKPKAFGVGMYFIGPTIRPCCVSHQSANRFHEKEVIRCTSGQSYFVRGQVGQEFLKGINRVLHNGQSLCGIRAGKIK
jgi:hypothetical protein